jgi:site-specific DNA-methyltransferase (adenine-specific)
VSVTLHHGDCLEVMPTIADASVDMVLCDLPYGTTACKWDTVIPFAPLWEQYRRIVKRNGAIVLFGSQPFTTDLINSNRAMFRYTWVWDKRKGGNIFLAKQQPMKVHEDVVVFSAAPARYYPQMEPRAEVKRSRNSGTGAAFGGNGTPEPTVYEYTHTYPKSILPVSNAAQQGKHPTQKPVALGEYLIRTYTNEGEVVLDNTMGVGSFGVAAVNTNRRFIGIERDETYYGVAWERIEAAQSAARQLEFAS